MAPASHRAGRSAGARRALRRSALGLLAALAILGPAVLDPAPAVGGADPFGGDALSARVVPEGERRTLDVEGRGFAGASEVFLVLVEGTAPTLAQETGTGPLPARLDVVQTAQDGTFMARTTVPGDVPPGSYVIEARGRNPDGSYETMGRKVSIGPTAAEADEGSLWEVFRWVALALVALGATVLLAVGGRFVAGVVARR